MPNKDLGSQINFLLGVAFRKCGSLEDAQDLVQETLLASIAYLSKGKTIEEPKAWLLTVLNRKYYDTLRKKYNYPKVTIGEYFDIADDNLAIDEIEKSDEAEAIRREIAYLSKIYREVIVRFYMNGEEVGGIAAALGIPAGTVKSRLSAGRERMKKGLNRMDSYHKQSYEPIELHVANSGQWGMNGEPASLVNHDLIAQNLLYLAYSRPITIEHLSREIGIPAAYIEPIIQKLVKGELMRQTGNKVYTDFIISTLEDRGKHIPAQKQLVENHFEQFWSAIQTGLDKLRQTDYFLRFNSDQRHALELYFVFNCMDYGIHRTFNQIFGKEQIITDRPNGGKWIAFGYANSKKLDYREHMDIMKHAYAGERHVYLENYLGSKMIGMHVYDPEGFPVKLYHRDPYYKSFYGEQDGDYLKLLYIIHSGINPVETGFNIELLKSIPWLTECKILRSDNGKVELNIPVLTQKESESLWQICAETKSAMTDDLKELLSGFYRGKKQEIPLHLKSVPLQKQYLWSNHAFLFATLRCAIKRGKLYDGGYDLEEQPPYPMIFIVEG